MNDESETVPNEARIRRPVMQARHAHLHVVVDRRRARNLTADVAALVSAADRRGWRRDLDPLQLPGSPYADLDKPVRQADLPQLAPHSRLG